MENFSILQIEPLSPLGGILISAPLFTLSSSTLHSVMDDFAKQWARLSISKQKKTTLC